MREEENSGWGREKNKERVAGRDRKIEIELDILKSVKKNEKDIKIISNQHNFRLLFENLTIAGE